MCPRQAGGREASVISLRGPLGDQGRGPRRRQCIGRLRVERRILPVRLLPQASTHSKPRVGNLWHQMFGAAKPQHTAILPSRR